MSCDTGRAVAAIHLGRPLPDGSSSQPGSLGAKHPCSCERETPIWPCSGWGLPCGRRCRSPGALLPHPFTLACAPDSPKGVRAIGGMLSVALSLNADQETDTRRALPATLVSWSPDFPRTLRHAAAWPPDRGDIGAHATIGKQIAPNAAVRRALPRPDRPDFPALRRAKGSVSISPRRAPLRPAGQPRTAKAARARPSRRKRQPRSSAPD